MKASTTQSTGSISPETTADTSNSSSINKVDIQPTADLMKNRYTEGIMRHLALTQINKACQSVDPASLTIGSTVSNKPCWITTHPSTVQNLTLKTASENTSSVNTTILAYGDTLSTNISPVNRFETTFTRLQEHIQNNSLILNQSVTFKVYWHLLIDWLHHWNLFGMTCKATMTSTGYHFSIERIELYDPLFDSSLYFTTQDELYKTDHSYVNQLPPGDNSNSSKTSTQNNTSIIQLLINAAEKVLNGSVTVSEDNIIVNNEFLFPRLQNDNYNCGTWCLTILDTLFKSKISNAEYAHHSQKAEHYRLQQIRTLQSTPAGMKLLTLLHQENVDSELQSLQYTNKSYISPARLIQIKIFEKELKHPLPHDLQKITSLWQLVNNDLISLKQFKQQLVSHYQHLRQDQSSHQHTIHLIHKYLLRVDNSKEIALHAENPGFSYCCEHLLNKQYQIQNSIIFKNYCEYFKKTEQFFKYNHSETDTVKTLTQIISEIKITTSFIESLKKTPNISQEQLTELKKRAPTITSLMSIDSLLIPLPNQQASSFCQPKEIVKSNIKLLKGLTVKLVRELFDDINPSVFYNLYFSYCYLAEDFNFENSYIAHLLNQGRLSTLITIYKHSSTSASYRVLLNNSLQHYFILLFKNNRNLISFLLHQTELTKTAQLILTNENLKPTHKQDHLFQHFLEFIKNSTPSELSRHLYKKRNEGFHFGITFTALTYFLSKSRDISPILVDHYQQQFLKLQQDKEFTLVANIILHLEQKKELLSIEKFLTTRYQQQCPIAQHLLNPIQFKTETNPLLLLQIKSDVLKLSMSRFVLQYKQLLRENILKSQSIPSSLTSYETTDLNSTLKDIVFYWAHFHSGDDACKALIDKLITHNSSPLTEWKLRIEVLQQYSTQTRLLDNFDTVTDFLYCHYLPLIRSDNSLAYSRTHSNLYQFIRSIQTQPSIKLHYPAHLLSNILTPSQKSNITLIKQRIVHAFIQSPYQLDSMSALLRQVTLFDTDIQSLSCSTLSIEFTQFFFNGAHKILQLSLFHEPNSITVLYFISRWLKRFFNTLMMGPAVHFLHALVNAYNTHQAQTFDNSNSAAKRKREDVEHDSNDQLTWCRTVIETLRNRCISSKESPANHIDFLSNDLNKLKPHLNHVLLNQLLTALVRASSTSSTDPMPRWKKAQPLIINLLLQCNFCLDDFLMLQSTPPPEVKQSIAINTAVNCLLRFSISSSKEFDQTLLMIIPTLCRLTTSLNLQTHDKTDFEHTNVACALPLLHQVLFKNSPELTNTYEATINKRSKTEEGPSQ